MSQRILVFESDAAFAGELKSSFERLGAVVDVAGDGPAGLSLAESQRPDLILLSIELPGMNGFLVCKKIKKTAELENVPLVILSSEVDEETFEQHKKLRTRADEYLRKPIAFQDLFERVKRWVPDNGAVAVEEDTIEIDDAVDVGEEDVIVVADDTIPPASTPEPASVEVARFADEALDDLIIDSPAAHEAALPPMAAPMPSVRDVAPPPRMSAAPEPGGANAAELERLRRELAAAEQKTQAADKRASAAELRASGAEKSLDAAKKTGGVSSRELLDLREQLNRKDRELLDLRDQVTGRDKQLIEASDRSLAVERDLQDTRDKVSDLQRELDKKNEVVGALTTDKEASKKRLDDVKARMERGEAKVKELSAELDGIKVQHAKEVEDLKASHADSEAKLRAQNAAAVERAKEEHAAALAAQQTAHEGELSEQRDEHAVALKAAADAAAQDKHGALDAQNATHSVLLQEKLAEVAAAHKAEFTAALSAHEVELRVMREQLEQKAASDLATQADKHTQDLARVGKALAETESKHALLEERFEETDAARSAAERDLRSTGADRDEKSKRVAELDGELSTAKAKLARDAEVMDRVRKAMAIGLGLLDDKS